MKKVSTVSVIANAQKAASGRPFDASGHIIRYGTEADYPRIEAMWLEAFPEDTEADVKEYWSSFFTSKRLWIWETDGEAVAMLSVFDTLYNGSPAAYIYALATDSRYRGQGIAREFLSAVQNTLRLPIIVHPEHNGVEVFYRRTGFTVLPEEALRAMARESGIESLLMDSGDGYIRFYRES